MEWAEGTNVSASDCTEKRAPVIRISLACISRLCRKAAHLNFDIYDRKSSWTPNTELYVRISPSSGESRSWTNSENLPWKDWSPCPVAYRYIVKHCWECCGDDEKFAAGPAKGTRGAGSFFWQNSWSYDKSSCTKMITKEISISVLEIYGPFKNSGYINDT